MVSLLLQRAHLLLLLLAGASFTTAVGFSSSWWTTPLKYMFFVALEISIGWVGFVPPFHVSHVTRIWSHPYKPGPPILRRQPNVSVLCLCVAEHFGLLLWNPFVCFSEIVSSLNAEQSGRPDAQQITGLCKGNMSRHAWWDVPFEVRSPCRGATWAPG